MFSFPNIWHAAELVGQTPWSARVPLDPLLATLSVTAAAAFLAWAVRGRASSVFGPSVDHGPPDRKAVALTFDDGPSESTPSLQKHRPTKQQNTPPTLS